MITQPNPQLEARPAAPAVQHNLPRHLPGRPRLRPMPPGTRAIDTHLPNIALAGLQLLIGYEWLLAGGDKLLLGAFPAQLDGMLLAVVSGGHWLASSLLSCRNSSRLMPYSSATSSS